MTRSILAIALAIGMISPAFAAAEADKTAKYYVVKDTVENCSVIEAKPSEGLTVIAEGGGYESEDAAKSALKEVSEKEGCKGVVE